MTVEQLIEHYGYYALFLGSFLEGETVVVLAGFAARRGYLALPWVLVVAFTGALLGDQVWFQIGRLRGQAMIDRRPRWRARAHRVHAMLIRHELKVLLGFRFVPGTRMLTPLILASTGYRPWRFAVLNAAGALVWSVTISLLGYFFGHAAELLLAEVKQYELYVLTGVAAGGTVLYFIHRARRERIEVTEEPLPPGDGGP